MAALHLKLDELIRVNETARNKLLTLEDMTEEELARLKGSFSQLAGKPPNVELLSEPRTIWKQQPMKSRTRSKRSPPSPMGNPEPEIGLAGPSPEIMLE
jgi:Low affinity iron permease